MSALSHQCAGSATKHRYQGKPDHDSVGRTISSGGSICRMRTVFVLGDVLAWSVVFVFAAPEERQVDSISHGLIAGVAWVQVIPAVVERKEECRVTRIAQSLIEVDHRIECAAGPDPVIDRLTVGLSCPGGSGRCQGTSKDLESSHARARDELRKEGD